MGWTYTHKGKKTVKEFFSKSWDSEGVKVLDCAVVKMRTAYLAVEVTRQDETKYVAGVICLLNYRPHDFPYDFGYKDMDETCGVHEDECPERILNLLSPVEEFTTEDSKGREWALAWRERCWANVNAKKNAPKIKKGDVVEFGTPLNFQRGWKVSLMVRTHSKKLHFKAVHVNLNGDYVLSYTPVYFKPRREDLVSGKIVGHIEV